MCEPNGGLTLGDLPFFSGCRFGQHSPQGPRHDGPTRAGGHCRQPENCMFGQSFNFVTTNVTTKARPYHGTSCVCMLVELLGKQGSYNWAQSWAYFWVNVG
jgi:hypothetical protein